MLSQEKMVENFSYFDIFDRLDISPSPSCRSGIFCFCNSFSLILDLFIFSIQALVFSFLAHIALWCLKLSAFPVEGHIVRKHEPQFKSKWLHDACVSCLLHYCFFWFLYPQTWVLCTSLSALLCSVDSLPTALKVISHILSSPFLFSSFSFTFSHVSLVIKKTFFFSHCTRLPSSLLLSLVPFIFHFYFSLLYTFYSSLSGVLWLITSEGTPMVLLNVSKIFDLSLAIFVVTQCL